MACTPGFRISRRKLLQAGAATVGASLAGPLWAADAGTALIVKRIPSTGEALPVIGIGTNQFGGVSAAELAPLLARMSELGGTVIDTAAMYGDSEVNIGAALAERKLRPKMFVATKFNAAGQGYGPPDPVSGLDSFERSLKRLQMDKVDLLMAHSLGSVEPLMPVLTDLRKAGRIRYLGITAIQSGQHAQLMEYMKKYPVDFVQLDYSLGNRVAANDVLPLAQERRIAVMLDVPLGGGGSRSLLQAAAGRALPPWAAEIQVNSWSQFFLKYVVSHPAVTCAIPGTTNILHMEDNQGAGRGVLPDSAMRKRMEQYWDAA